MKSLKQHTEWLRLQSKIFLTENFSDFFSRKTYLVIFFLAFLLGVGTKVLLNDVVTIGFEDYKLKGSENALDLNFIQKDLIAKGETLVAGENTVPHGETCSE